MARVHFREKQGRRVSLSLSVRFDDEAARRDLTGWKGRGGEEVAVGEIRIRGSGDGERL